MKKRVRKEGVCCSRGAATPFINNDLSQEQMLHIGAILLNASNMFIKNADKQLNDK